MKRLFSALLALSLVLALAAAPASALEAEDARALLRDRYVDPIPEAILSLDSLDEILEALGDPYTTYMTAEEYESFLTAVNGDEVLGIGVSVQNAFDNGFQIMSVLPGSPALEAGLEPGDRIVAVDGTVLTESMDVRACIAGDEGTSVTISVLHPSGRQENYTLVRRVVDIPIVTYEQVDGAGYIDCTSFGESTPATVREALEALDGQVNVWIMDLRRNPGGTDHSAAGAAGYFTGGGLVMVFFRGNDGKYSFVGINDKCPDLTDKPLIVLTSAYSASGAELFAGAARDYGVAIGVGQRTYGKGIAQIVLDENNYPQLFRGDALKLTAYRFFSPNGITNHNLGVLPTLLISDENAERAAMLLSCGYSNYPENHLKLELGGFTFCIDLDEALEKENRAALTELLEALPPDQKVAYSTGKSWDSSPSYSPAALAKKLGLDFQSRYGFPDLEGVPQANKIRTLAVYNLISGYEDGTFRPTGAVTRAEFAAMLASALALPAAENSTVFSDVAPGAWYAGAVSALYNRGFLSGYEDGTFRPGAPVTYQEAVTVLAAAAAWTTMDGYAVQKEGVPIGETERYYDFAPWAQTAARTLTELGMELDASLAGRDASRAQTAGLIYDMMDACGLFWGI